MNPKGVHFPYMQVNLGAMYTVESKATNYNGNLVSYVYNVLRKMSLLDLMQETSSFNIGNLYTGNTG